MAEQLLSLSFLSILDRNDVHVMHVHSGETRIITALTKPSNIKLFVDVANTAGDHCIVFTTYHSLNRLEQAAELDKTPFTDEAHNSVQRNFFTRQSIFEIFRCYFFKAPKHSTTVTKPGMNMPEIYGNVICQVDAPELVEGGYILPPKVVVKQLDMVQDKKMIADRDSENLLFIIDDNSLNKILICARSTKQIMLLISQSSFCKDLSDRGYSWMTITAKTGAIIDGQKVNREVFFETLNAWGRDPNKKFVVLHHSILSEGINVSGLEVASVHA